MAQMTKPITQGMGEEAAIVFSEALYRNLSTRETTENLCYNSRCSDRHSKGCLQNTKTMAFSYIQADPRSNKIHGLTLYIPVL